MNSETIARPHEATQSGGMKKNIYIYILLFLSIHILLVAWTVDQHIPASRFWNVQCSELLPCICCFIGNAHTHRWTQRIYMGMGQIASQPTPWSCIFRIFCFGFVAPTIFSHITCNSKGTSTLLIRTSVGRTKWKVVRYSWINSTFWTLDISGSLVFRHCLDMIRSGEALLPGWTPKGLHVCWVCWNSTCVLLQSRFGSLFHGLAMPPKYLPILPRHCGQKREDVDAFRQYCSEVISGVSDARPEKCGIGMNWCIRKCTWARVKH